MVFIPLQRASETEASSFHDHQLTHLLIHAFGGYLPEGPATPDQVQHVLNVGSSSGAWSTAYGSAHPSVHITGLERDPDLIAYARQTAQRECLPHVHYHLLPENATSFPFPENSFDLMYMQYCGLLHQLGDVAFDEYRRLLRPGGHLCLVAWEQPLTNALAWEELAGLLLKAHAQDERSIAAYGRHTGLLCELEPLCRQAGFSDCLIQLHPIIFSYGTPEHLGWAHTLLPSTAMQHRLIELGLVTPKRLDTLIEQQLQEMRSPVFQGLLPIAILWGTTSS